ncbi:hypothetical protein AB0M47_39670 [Hamadaea sp. NPDC051192]|uniref:hypothetical protein n=1 Tax=Hamadaea sp. NPDC051192 TaxID=3154940 RepID=UPI00342D2447
MTDPADDLYGLPQAEFTAARDAAARDAKAAGDKMLAARLAKLRKPNAVAWLANQLVRQRREAVEQLVDLGDQLRAATARLDGEQLRRLSTRQHEVVADLVRQAHELADRPVADATERGLEQTLRSALADPAAADELLAGQLSEGLSRIGFTSLLSAVPTDNAVDTSTQGAPAGKPRSKAAAAAGESAKPETAVERTERKAEKRLQAAAEAARKRAEEELADAEGLLRTARDTVDELRQRLDEAYEGRAEADRAVQAARKRLQQADRDARLAARGLTDVSVRASDR